MELERIDRYEYANLRQTRGRERKTYRAGPEPARVRTGGTERQLLLYVCPNSEGLCRAG